MLALVKKLFFTFIILCFFPGAVFSQKIPLPQNVGKVILNNTSEEADIPPVIFDHWLHRAKFTCRVCHVDIGFAMEEGATGITADLNMQGMFCGSCHNGKRTIDDKVVFDSCAEKTTPEEKKRCARCHSTNVATEREYQYDTFTQNFPRLNIGRLIDWEKAEDEGIIKLIDFLPGISFHRDQLKAQEDFSIDVTTWASDVIFSHKKHAIWNGCELCHPNVFPSSKKGTVQYNMFQIMEGEYCGICHQTVAFSVWLCYKCHKNPVR
jgi:c(7)-type cytochrome triheme protein